MAWLSSPRSPPRPSWCQPSRPPGTSTRAACSKSPKHWSLSMSACLQSRGLGLVSLALILVITACAPAPSAGRSSPGDAQQPAAAPVRTLDMAIQVEPSGIASRALVERGVALHTTKRAFNADLVLLDDLENPQPYLADALPQLNSDSWRVFPDGTMETTYRLRPNLTWHDGSPLTTDDWVFSLQVYSTPALGLSSLPPFGSISEVVPVDARTMTIRWKRAYPDAGQLAHYSFPALPRHILGQAL